MMRTTRTLGIHFTLMIAMLLALAGTADAAVSRLRVSANGRFLEKSNGQPFFWAGDTNWRLYKLLPEEITSYFHTRRVQGFNVIQGPVLLMSPGDPETENAFGHSNLDPGSPNESWFMHIDWIVSEAERQGLYIALTAAWGDDWDHFSSGSQAREYGRFLGQRYGNRSNVIWIVAGEYCIDGLQPTMKSMWAWLARGIDEGAAQPQLITVHGSFQQGLQSSSLAYHGQSWLDFNMVHSGQSGDNSTGDTWRLIETDWRKSPAKPVIDGEANYEQLGGWDAFGTRRRAYWSVFAGAFGHTYGANGVWSSYRGGVDDTEGQPAHTWDVAVRYIGGYDVKHLRRLMESRPMLNRIPAQSMLMSSAGGAPDRMQATRDRLGRYAMIYVPGRNRDFTVDLRPLSGTHAKAWWYDPRIGRATYAGLFTSGSARSFRTPNSGQDWVLILDDAARGYPRPGQGGPLR